MPDPENLPLQTSVKYNPHLWSADELRAVFVARGRELEGVLDRLRATAPGRVPQHLLVTGYRGMGKTTLLRRIALAVADDPELASGWIPLTFPEEQYTVSTLAELWMNVLDALADALEREGAPPGELEQLDAGVRALPALDPGAREVAALELLESWIDEHRRRILLLIDSSDLLFAALGRTEGKRGKGSDAGATPLWRLRKTLSHCPGILWLGASYQALEADHQYSDAFHDFFEGLELRPLSLAEMRKAMLALARTFGAGKGLRGEAAVAEMARGLDARPERLKTLRALTGGNPRTTVILYELFAAGWQGDVHSDLKALLDLMTPLYKARMEHLAEQPRKLLAHLMEHWAPMGAGDLARAAGIPNTTVSGQLTRLEAEGLVEKTSLAGTRRSGYQVSERFFNIWYLMRNSPRRMRQRLSGLVEFMRLWFSVDDLQTPAQRNRTALGSGTPLLPQPQDAMALTDATPHGSEEHQLGRLAEAEAAYRRAVELAPRDPFPIASLARLLAKGGDEHEAPGLYRSAAELAGKEPAPDTRLLSLMLFVQLQLGNMDEARLALARLADMDSPDTLTRIVQVARESYISHSGAELADLMEQSAQAEVLRPTALALRAAEGDGEAFCGVAKEIRYMAEHCLAFIRD